VTAKQEFIITPASTWESGDFLDLATVTEHRLYVDGASDPAFTLAMPELQWRAPNGFFEPGDRIAQWSTVAVTDGVAYESDPSPALTFTVELDTPNPPSVEMVT